MTINIPIFRNIEAIIIQLQKKIIKKYWKSTPT